MNKIKFQSKRPYLSISEAIKEYECTEEDLIYEASIGELTLYVLADNWEAEQVYAFDPAKNSSGLSVSYSGPITSPFPDSNNPEEFQSQYQKWVNGKACQDTSIGPYTYYGRQGVCRVLYERTWSGHQPVATELVLNYRKGSATTPIELDINKSLNISDASVERFLRPKCEVMFAEALAGGKIFVMKDELDKLAASESVKPDEQKPAGAVSRKTLLKLIIAMAVQGYKFEPSAKKNDAGTDIKTDLEKMGLGLDAQTIRDALKEAATVLPS